MPDTTFVWDPVALLKSGKRGLFLENYRTTERVATKSETYQIE